MKKILLATSLLTISFMPLANQTRANVTPAHMEMLHPSLRSWLHSKWVQFNLWLDNMYNQYALNQLGLGQFLDATPPGTKTPGAFQVAMALDPQFMQANNITYDGTTITFGQNMLMFTSPNSGNNLVVVAGTYTVDASGEADNVTYEVTAPGQLK